MSKKVELFGSNVMLKQQLREGAGGPKIHLPDNAKEETKEALFEFAVEEVGPDVTRVEVGDVVMANFSPHQQIPHPIDTGRVIVIIDESRIDGRVTCE